MKMTKHIIRSIAKQQIEEKISLLGSTSLERMSSKEMIVARNYTLNRCQRKVDEKKSKMRQQGNYSWIMC